MSAVTSKYHVTMDSIVEDAIVIHFGSNQNIKFTRCGNGQYYFDTVNILHMETPQYDITDDEQTDKYKFQLLVTPLSPQLLKIKDTLVDVKLKEQTMHYNFW